VLRRTDTTSFDFTTSDVGNETPVLFNAPNYLIDITKQVKSHPEADLMVIRSNYPYAQFDPNDDYSADQQWRMVTYNWTDRNRDRRLFTDRDRDGTLDEFPSAETTIGSEKNLLKVIPHVDGTPRICELVEYYLVDVDLKGAWTGPASLSLWSHALAPVAELPVLEVVSAMHLIADLTLPLGKVVHDYLKQPIDRRYCHASRE